MPTFDYIAKDVHGKTVRGDMSAATPHEVIQVLREQDMLLTHLSERKLDKKGSGRVGRWNVWNGVSQKELVAFTHQLATLLQAGVPLVECLDILSSQEENPTFQTMVMEIRNAVEGGTTLVESFGKFPAVFPSFYLNMIEVGEATGQLDESLIQLAQYLEKQARLRSRIVSGLAYPTLLVGVALVVLVFLLVWVVPLFSGLFKEMGQTLPWLTEIVISLAQGLRGHLWQTGLLVLGAIVGLRVLWRNPAGRTFIDQLLLKLPLLGEVFRKVAVVRFTRTLGFLLQRGVPLITALGVSSAVTGNAVFREHLRVSSHQIQEGIPLSLTLQGSDPFPPLVSQMVRVGESTGSMDVMLHKIADLFEQEVDHTVAGLTALLEPAVILFVGSGIALVVIAMYLPIFSMGSLLD